MLERIDPHDSRYPALLEKRFNKRFSGRPDCVLRAGSAGEVVSAVQEAVAKGLRIVATSGGHCLEGFVSDPAVRVIVDVSPMKRIYHDAERGALAVEAGATVGETFAALSESWGTVIPLGEHPSIGMGGHVCGGAFGFLCRELGLAADYLYGVELVTVDEAGQARLVTATRDENDPHRDLWWAHTGGGAGNFGIVTRYWFRDMPRAPESILTLRARWSWNGISRDSFARLVDNYGRWCEQNAEPTSPNASLWALLEIHREQFGTIVVRAVTTAGAAAERQADAFLGAVAEGVPKPQNRELQQMAWLDFALSPFPDLFAVPPDGVSVKVKDALLKQRLTPRQIDVAYDYLTSTEFDAMGGLLGMATYGGRINAVDSDATAASQREAIADMACTTGWLDPSEERSNLVWVRAFYAALFADSGGVPVPNDAYDGTFINHPDTDLADPALNTSGVPWQTLYYKGNYERLQRVKRQWDPRNVFRHALSIPVS